MKIFTLILLINVIIINGCVPHPYFSQTSYTEDEPNIITYAVSPIYLGIKKQKKRLNKEVEMMMKAKCSNYVLLKKYVKSKGGGSGSIHSNGQSSTYSSTKTDYYSFEFKCVSKKDSIE